MSYLLNEELAGNQKQNIMEDRLTNPPMNVHSCGNLKRSGANSSGIRAAESSPYIVRHSKAILYQGREAMSICSPFTMIISLRTEGPPGTIGRFIPANLSFRLMNM